MLDQIPTVLRESAYGIGCTTWEVVRHVLLPQAGVSIIGAVMLGLGRALGETMAVTFVIGNANRLSLSIFDPGSTIASRIANEFNEADRPAAERAAWRWAASCSSSPSSCSSLARLLIARVKRLGADDGTSATRMRRRPPTPLLGRVRRSRYWPTAFSRSSAPVHDPRRAVLGWILLMLIIEGVGGLSPAVFTETTPGPGTEGGGIANAIVGSLVLTFLGIDVATPVGVMAGTYLAEYGKGSKLADVIRFVNDILLVGAVAS